MIDKPFADFYRTSISEYLDKIKITDHSLDKGSLEEELVSYYERKFTRMAAAFSDGFHGYDFADLFCGAGGLSAGLEQCGLRPVAAIDKDSSALLTYRFNRPWITGGQVWNEDIKTLVDNIQLEHVPLVVGGPPCQGFSNANKQRREGDERNLLYKYFVKSVEKARPDLFLMENVVGILGSMEAIRADFEGIGYHVIEPQLLNTCEFGFPQNRRRVFILGIAERHASIHDELSGIFLSALRAGRGEKRFVLWDAISDLPALEAKTQKNSTYAECRPCGYTFGGFLPAASAYAKYIAGGDTAAPLLNHKSKYNNARDIEIFTLLKPGERSDAESIQHINPYKSRSDIFIDKFYKLQPDEPSKTITAHMYYDCNMYIHPYQARGLTPREAARVQGFPDDYLFLGSPNEWYRQIGNAVSPLLARVIGHAVNEMLKRIYRV